MKTALIQLCSGEDPVANLPVTLDYVTQAARSGAKFILTPEVTNCVSTSREWQKTVLQHESDDPTLAELRRAAGDLECWILIGSLGLKTSDRDGRFANRSFLIGPDASIVARYDKIHMFDVNVTAEETYRESDGYRPGRSAVVADTEFGRIGLSICYDVRFPGLYQTLARHGATIMTVPAAFSPVTGAAHWTSLLRARAIETGSYVLAPAQTGHHDARQGKRRHTYGHSLAVSPWGEVLVDAGTEPGVHIFEMNDRSVTEARRKIPSLQHVRQFDDPA